MTTNINDRVDRLIELCEGIVLENEEIGIAISAMIDVLIKITERNPGVITDVQSAFEDLEERGFVEAFKDPLTGETRYRATETAKRNWE